VEKAEQKEVKTKQSCSGFDLHTRVLCRYRENIPITLKIFRKRKLIGKNKKI
jgi:hypothetical protein